MHAEQVDFSMDTRPFRDNPRNTIRGAMMSGTLLSYYGPLLNITFIVMIAITVAAKDKC
jgi:hypothetical protein